MLEFVFELILELLTEGCFALIRKHVKNKFLRGILYVLVVMLIVAIAVGIILLVFAIGAAMLEHILDILADFLEN